MKLVKFSPSIRNSALWKFAKLNNAEQLTRKLNFLRKKVYPEEWWGNEDSPPNNLLNYLVFTFERLKEEFDKANDEKEKQKKIAIGESKNSEECACINTGLFDKKSYLPIFMYFLKNTKEPRPKWFFYGFFDGTELSGRSLWKTLDSLPERANYISDPAALIYDYHFPIRPNIKHILYDRADRIPKEITDKYELVALRRQFDSAVKDTEKKLASNFHIAVPQYYNNEIQLLVPIWMKDEENKEPDFALAISREEDHYLARTILTMDQAYQNARVIVKPESEWLRPKQS